MESLKVWMFGKLRVQHGSTVWRWDDCCKIQRMFCYLMIHRFARHNREYLAELFWLNKSAAVSKKNLRQGLWQLQARCAEFLEKPSAAILSTNSAWVCLNPELDLWTDVGAFEQAYERMSSAGELDETRALPIWERLWPANRLPHYLLDLAERVCRVELDGATLTEIRGQTETELDDICWASADKSAVAVGYAAHRALAVAIRDELFDQARPDSAERDEDLDPYERDSAYLASVVEAGGAPWQPGSSAERRRGYWLWWLREAVPASADSSC